MLRQVRWFHHTIVGITAVGASALALFGIVGEPRLPERFDAKLVVIAPADPDDLSSDALRITEVIDQDFGREERRGHERFLPLDGGYPEDITARSPTAPDDVSDTEIESKARIRIGDPDVTVTGQHRYELAYTLPSARLSEGTLAVDVISPDESLETGRFEVVVTGFVLDDPLCAVGDSEDDGGCSLTRDGDVYRTVISPLEPGDGITVGGTIVGRTPIQMPPPPPLPEPRELPDRRLPLALAMLPVGLLAGAGVFRLIARAGRNQVFAGGAADAAFGTLPGPGADGSVAASSITQVTDRDLGDLATVEFAPPPGLDPWQGAVLLREQIDDSTVSAWFSGLAGDGAIELEQGDDDKLVITPGPRRDRLDAPTASLVDTLFANGDRVELDGYDEDFAALWIKIRDLQDATIKKSGWWKHLTPRNRHGVSGSFALGVASIGALVVAAALVAIGFIGLLTNVVAALVFAFVVTGLVAFVAYRRLLPARSPTGSALALRTESFRRFLDASEGQHVEWAWERGVVREYSAWAVALGAAAAWSKALEASSVVPDDASLRTPLLVYSMGSAMAAAHVQPSSSSGSGSSGGGFSGGTVGGGVGGGTSGSW